VQQIDPSTTGTRQSHGTEIAQSFAIIDGKNNLFNQIQNILVVNELDVAPINFLAFVLILFHLEYMLREDIWGIKC
jgi:hypothetical protein